MKARSRSPAAMRPSWCASPIPSACPALQLILKQLEDRGIPRFLFLNKIDSFDAQVRDILPILQPASSKPLVLRQIPIWENGVASGFVDLALERAFVYRPQAQAEVDRDAGERQGARDRGALQDARAARRLRRRADGAAALRRAAAARQGVRRSRQGAARRPDRAGAAGLGRERQRHPAAAEGAAPRGAVRRHHGQAPEAGERQVGRRRC